MELSLSAFVLFLVPPHFGDGAGQAAGHQTQVGTARGTEPIDEAHERRTEHFAEMNARQREQQWWWWRVRVATVIVAMC